jgi:hypothetical protein
LVTYQLSQNGGLISLVFYSVFFFNSIDILIHETVRIYRQKQGQEKATMLTPNRTTRVSQCLLPPSLSKSICTRCCLRGRGGGEIAVCLLLLLFGPTERASGFQNFNEGLEVWGEEISNSYSEPSRVQQLRVQTFATETTSPSLLTALANFNTPPPPCRIKEERRGWRTEQCSPEVQRLQEVRTILFWPKSILQ